MLARAVREVESGVQRGRATQTNRTKFQTVALLAREERTRIKTDASMSEPQRAEQLKRLDGIGTILAKTAALDTSLLSLLAEDAAVSDAAKDLKRDMLAAAEWRLPRPEEAGRGGPHPGARVASGGAAVGHLAPPRRPVPRPAVRDRRASHAAAAPAGRLGADRTAALVVRARRQRRPCVHGSAGAHRRPRPRGHGADAPPGRARRRGSGRTPDLPAGRRARLGKTAQSLLAAQAANAYPLLVVVRTS